MKAFQAIFVGLVVLNILFGGDLAGRAGFLPDQPPTVRWRILFIPLALLSVLAFLGIQRYERNAKRQQGGGL